MNWHEEPFEVVGADQQVRRGILTLPSRDASTLTLILLPAGLKDRVGPHRLYVHMARFLASHGVRTLRLDGLGIGESDGELAAAFNGVHYRRVQQGLYVADAELAMSALSLRYPQTRYVLGGLCGGAISGQLAAAADRHHRCAGVLSLSHVAVLDEEGPVALRSRSEVVANSKSYLRKLFSADAWKRLFSGDSSVASITANVTGLLGLMLERLRLRRVRWANENPAFFSSFSQLQQRGIKQLMIFGERDARWTAFRELVVEGFLGGQLLSTHYRIDVVPEANHEFYWQAWTQQVLEITLEWVNTLQQPGLVEQPARMETSVR